MARLSACYFCGTALDDALREYAVAADAQHDGQEATTVTLCPSCQEKLDRLLSEVGQAPGVYERETHDGAAESGQTSVSADRPSATDPDDVLVNPGVAERPPADTEADGGPEVDTGPDVDAGSPGEAETPSSSDTAADGEDTGPTTHPVVEGEHSVSALEYNKVMRLLQNREFPVDRQEIETVAANAYGLGHDECATVIDVAIDRGLIEEADGQLRRPEGA